MIQGEPRKASPRGEPRVALIHDELIRRGGAEVVFEELVRLFPTADVYSLYAGGPTITVEGVSHPIYTSFLQRFPRWFRRHPGRLLPFLPHAAEQFDFSRYDLVISSASGFVKGIITRSNVAHICYCHTPTRYVWEASPQMLRRHARALRLPLQILLHYLRLADFAAAQRVDIFLANSRYTQDRITAYYRRASVVVYPPIDTAFYYPVPTTRLAARKDAPFVLVGRLTPSKYFDHAIQVCEKLHYPLVIIGVGHDFSRLRRLAGRYTTFVGKISRDQLRSYYHHARALLQPGVEDFGMAAAEALACGTPVVALGKGGVREVVPEFVGGIFYSEPGPEGLAEALRRFREVEHRFLVEPMQHSIMKFSQYRFQQGIRRQVEKALKSGAPVT